MKKWYKKIFGYECTGDTIQFATAHIVVLWDDKTYKIKNEFSLRTRDDFKEFVDIKVAIIKIQI